MNCKKSRPVSLIIIFLFVLFLPGYGQINYPGLPAGTDNINVPFIKFPGVDREKLVSIDEQERLITGKKSLRFGKIIPVSLGIDNSGVFQSFNGIQVWRIGLWAPDARGLGLIFDRFDLADGEKVFIYSPGKIQVLGAFTAANMNKNKNLAVRPLTNDSIIIEFQFNINRKDALHIGSVVYDYLGIYNTIAAKDEWYNASGPCNVDINCTEGMDWQSEKNAVCREFIYKPDYGYSELCTGVLLSNTSETDVPYLLTSNHCIENSSHAENTLFVFQYESPYCEGPDGFVIKSISGSDLKATSTNLDFTLVELSKIPPITYNPIYAGWSNQDNPPDNSVTIHHPNGDVKKISVDNDPAMVASYSTFDDNAFWNILQWEIGTTEAGSSGAPLFDQDHRVIGILSGGDASCGGSVNDYFLRFSNAWADYSLPEEQLKFWLDPENSGATFVNRRDPYAVAKLDCDTVSNISIAENKKIYSYINPGSGTITGHNTGLFKQYAEKFIIVSEKNITGVRLNVARAIWSDNSDSVKIKIWYGTNQPGQLLYEKKIQIKAFVDSAYNFVDFDSVINVTSDFYIGYEVSYNPGFSASTQFAVFHAEERGVEGKNTAMTFDGSDWVGFPDIPQIAINTSLDLQPVICGEIPPLGVGLPEKENDLNIVVYPNPGSGLVTLLPDGFDNSPVRVQVYNMAGYVLKEFNIKFTGSRIDLDLTGMATGLYFLRISQGTITETLKVSIIR